jgi:hypothetical protein
MDPDLLMFVGRGFYDEESFIKEIRSMGASKRVRQFPTEAGQNSAIWFAMHGLPKSMEPMYNATGAIFCIANLDQFQEIVSDDEIDLALEDVGRKVQFRVLRMEDVSEEPERGCGRRHIGRYITTGQEVTVLMPMPIWVPHFRGYRYISSSKVNECLKRWKQSDLSTFRPPEIFDLCDDSQLSKQELLALHFLKQNGIRS